MTSGRRARRTVKTSDRRTAMYDLRPGTRTLSELIVNVRDDQLGAPTPSEEMTLGDVIDHVNSFCVAFTAAAKKEALPEGAQRPVPDASNLGDDWRERIPQRLDELAAAWTDEEAWQGIASLRPGLEFPGEVAGMISIDEVVVHGWDIAVATGQEYNPHPQLVEAALQFVGQAVKENPQGTPGLFGPAVEVPANAAPLDRLI